MSLLLLFITLLFLRWQLTVPWEEKAGKALSASVRHFNPCAHRGSCNRAPPCPQGLRGGVPSGSNSTTVWANWGFHLRDIHLWGTLHWDIKFPNDLRWDSTLSIMEFIPLRVWWEFWKTILCTCSKSGILSAIFVIDVTPNKERVWRLPTDISPEPTNTIHPWSYTILPVVPSQSDYKKCGHQHEMIKSSELYHTVQFPAACLKVRRTKL